MDQELSNEKDALFGRRRFVFWCVAPFLFLSACVFALMYDHATAKGWTLRIAIPALCMLAALGLYDVRRFAWAMRATTGIVFVGFAWYFIDEVFCSNHEFVPGPRSQASPWNAARGLVVIGLPALWYTVFGRLDPRRRVRSRSEPMRYL